MENIRGQSNPKESQITYWADLHTCHLKRTIESMMLDPGGRVLFIDCILKHESPRSPGGAQKRRVIFDQNFILYRIVALLSPLETYEIKALLKQVISRMGKDKSISEVFNELCLPPNVTDTPEEEEVSADFLGDPTFASFLDEIDVEIENGVAG